MPPAPTNKYRNKYRGAPAVTLGGFIMTRWLAADGAITLTILLSCGSGASATTRFARSALNVAFSALSASFSALSFRNMSRSIVIVAIAMLSRKGLYRRRHTMSFTVAIP